jgi:hypothetical protein
LKELVLDGHAMFTGHSKGRLEQAKLQTLKAGGWKQVISEVEEIKRGHGFDDSDLIHQDFLYLCYTLDSGNDRGE